MKKRNKILLAIFILVVLIGGGYWYTQYFSHDSLCPVGANVALIKVNGLIVTYSDNLYYGQKTASSEEIVSQIERASKDEKIKMIVVSIDSHGGYPVAGEEIMNAIKRTDKPTMAVIRESGVSMGYIVATGADVIYASEFSDVGGIGFTYSYFETEEETERGEYVDLSSAKFKDIGSYGRSLTEEEEDLIMRDVYILHDSFVEIIAKNRDLDVEYIEELADGSSFLGKTAKEKDLIDEIGDLSTVKDWLDEGLNIEIIFCNY